MSEDTLFGLPIKETDDLPHPTDIELGSYNDLGRKEMDAPDDQFPDLEDPVEQHLLFKELFLMLEACDSKRVDDFAAELNESVVYIINTKGMR